MRRIKSRSFAFQALVLVALLLGGASVYQFCLWKQRPMFHNTFSRHPKGGILYQWIPDYPHSDELGNVAIADYRLNLLVVFLVSESRIIPTRFMYPRPTDTGVSFPLLQDEDQVDFFVPIIADRLIVFRADGSQQEFPLSLFEAERIHKLLDNYDGEMQSLLEELGMGEWAL